MLAAFGNIAGMPALQSFIKHFFTLFIRCPLLDILPSVSETINVGQVAGDAIFYNSKAGSTDAAVIFFIEFRTISLIKQGRSRCRIS